MADQKPEPEDLNDYEEPNTEEQFSEPIGEGNGLDFEEEAGNLSQGWFNPDPGEHEVLFKDNGRKETRTYEGETREVVVFTIETGEKSGEHMWSVTKGRSETSLYGQLVKVGAAREGLKGETVSVIVQGEGTDRTYTVPEAANL